MMQNEGFLRFARAVVVSTWLVAVLAFFFPVYDWAIGPLARGAFWFLLVAHTAEFFVFRNVYRNAPGSLARHFFANLIFGALHLARARSAIEDQTRT